MSMVRNAATVALFALVLAISAGCAQLFQPPGPMENYALLEGAEATHPAFIDGDPKTIGETAFPQSEGATRTGIESPPTEAYILLPDVFTINEIRIHSDSLKGIDLLVEDPTQGWKIYDKLDGLSGPVTVIKMKGIVRASGIKLRVRSSTGDQALRQKNLRTDRFGNRFFAGETRAPAPIAEIEVLGPSLAPADAPEDEISSSMDDDIGAILRGDLSN